ncbi:MAG: polyphosphate polymerase domain-containing protein [Fibrobacter sp.]|nr:polyphosphate polymerase domain-containing protein [Fibrobacter sp.]
MNRTDQKYVTTVSRLLQLLALTEDSYYVQEIDGQRLAAYRTVYWDDPEEHNFFHRHQHGLLPRTKVRARTYVDSDLSFLEVKKKNNPGKTRKERIRVPSIDAVIGGEGDAFLQEQTGFSFARLTPTVGNRFHRITLVNKGKTERLTIDFDLRFDNFETHREHALDNIVVIELKRDGRVFSPVLALLRQLRIKPSGFSKYCMGMCYTGDGLRINNFKTRLRRVERISRTDA